ncbi:MAG: GNAT family N-acetyltransferase [Alphaproteobacteria bacterium]|nr:GNAT family N-acetyltransferase [Alphaproteobacteria bacterium]
MVDATMTFRSHQANAAPATDGAGGDTVVSVAAAGNDLSAYAELCNQASHAPAQSHAWVAAWAQHASPDGLLVIVRCAGRPVYALPLDVEKLGPFRVARLMSGRHANGNFPAADPAFLASGAFDMAPVVASIRAARPNIDVLALERLLPEHDGIANPLAALPRFPSPNLSLAVSLEGGFDALLSRSSGKRKRKKHRSQTRKFEAAGGFRRIEATTPAETARLLDAFFTMKKQRFEQMGVGNVFAEPAVQAFFRTLFAKALDETPPRFVLHALEVAGLPRAITGSSRDGKRLICEFGAIEEDDLAHASPGDFLFFENIDEACREGLEVYDFSVGDEPYKRLWCDIETRHFDVTIPLTPKGRLLALQMRQTARLKAFVKNSPLVWKLTKVLRRRTAGVAQPAGD